MNRLYSIILVAALAATGASAKDPPREADGYTRYELLAPATHKFRIVYEITAASPGATHYYNPIRPGSTASDEHVFDRATGTPLKFREVDGATAGMKDAKPEDRFIEVTLARPVPADGGGGRVLIDKTYEDSRSYREEGDTIVFDRSLGIKRNAVVLPPGYALVSCNYPSQVLQEADGRIRIAFWNNTPAQAPLRLTARRVAGLSATPSSMAAKLDERAHQSRNIVYRLNAPETHSFALTHDYTETRPGTATYVNIVRAGSKVTAPSGRDLDTGAPLRFEVVRGDAVRAAEPEAKDVGPDAEAVVFRFGPVPPGGSRRLRFAETYADPVRYTVTAGELVWHRSLGRADNAVVLPAGWILTNSSVPATVSEEDGRTRLDFINPRTDEIDTIITARRPG